MTFPETALPIAILMLLASVYAAGKATWHLKSNNRSRHHWVMAVGGWIVTAIMLYLSAQLYYIQLHIEDRRFAAYNGLELPALPAPWDDAKLALVTMTLASAGGVVWYLYNRKLFDAVNCLAFFAGTMAIGANVVTYRGLEVNLLWWHTFDIARVIFIAAVVVLLARGCFLAHRFYSDAAKWRHTSREVNSAQPLGDKQYTSSQFNNQQH